MEIRSNFMYGNKAVNESYTAKANKLGTGKKDVRGIFRCSISSD